MAITFPDSGLSVLPTGAIGVAFRVDGDTTVPADIVITASDLETEVATNFTDLQTIEAGDGWHYVTRTTPLPLGRSYNVDVVLDGVIAHTEDITIPLPGRRRSALLRQRLYEVIYDGFLADDLMVIPYGTPHAPGTVNNDFKSVSGTVVEVGVARIDAGYYGSRQQVSNVTIPLNFYSGMTDSAEDVEELVADAEDVFGYLLETDWLMASFATLQGNATISSPEPELNDDRKMAILRATITVPMRRQLKGN